MSAGEAMPTTSAAGRGHSDAANRSSGATRALFAGTACPHPAAEAPAGPARRARRASPRSTPCSLRPYFVCPTGHRRHAPDKMDGPPLRTRLRTALAIRRPLRCGRAWGSAAAASPWIEGRRGSGRSGASA